MQPLNINNEDDTAKYEFLRDPDLVGALEDFLVTIVESDQINKQLVMGIEELIKDTPITDNVNLNEFTSYASKLGLQETKNIIKKVLADSEIAKPNESTIDSTSALASKTYNNICNLINRLVNANADLNLDLVSDINDGKYKLYDYATDSKLTNIRDLDLFELLYYDANHLGNITGNINLALYISKHMHDNELKPDYMFINIFTDLHSQTDEFNIKSYLTDELRRYTLGEFLNKLSNTQQIINYLNELKGFVIDILHNDSTHMPLQKIERILSKINGKITSSEVVTNRLLMLFNKQR